MLLDINQRVHPEKWRIAPHVITLETSIIREILKISSQPGVISFAGGLPAPEMFPVDELQQVLNDVLKIYGSECLQYSFSCGIPQLRNLIAQRATERGTPSTSNNILICAGAQQGIELIARAFIDPGDYVLVENPSYLGALQAFNYYQARYVTVEMDKNGMLVDQVEAKLIRYRPKLIYTVSNFHNPTGITMSVDRRRQLVDLAIQYDIPIIDDNPYGDIQFAGERLPTIKSYGGEEVIALRSFSKTVAPGFRLGWMNGPASIIQQFEKVKQCADLHTNSFTQYLIYEFIKRGYLEPHQEKIKADYLKKRDIMVQMMEKYFPEGITWTCPNGGLFLWVTLPEQVSSQELFPKAIELKVAYVPGASFYPNGGGQNTLRLNFSNATHADIEEGIRRLGKLFKENM